MNLQGKVLISTVYSHKSAEIRNIFEPLGATVIDFPMTEIETAYLTTDIKNALFHIENYDWIIFTSSNGVIHFLKLLELSGLKSGILSSRKIAAIGVKTANELKKNCLKADFTGTGNSAKDLANELTEKEQLQDCNILLPLGNLAPDTLEKWLSKTSKVTRINIYNTMKAGIYDDGPIERIKNNYYDLVLFTSPSAVANFIDSIGSEIKKSALRAASIGNVTTFAAEQFGISCLVTASRSTYEGMADEIVNYYTTKK